MPLRSYSTAEIALVNVPYGSSDERSMRPLGLAYLGAYLNAHDVNARGFDFSDSPHAPEELVHKFRLFEFPAVGLSFYNVNAPLAYRMAREIKRQNPSCTVVAGGPHVSAVYDTVFNSHPEIDIVVRNEGEEALLEVLSALRERRSLNGIGGVAYHVGQEMFIGPNRGRINNLDELPAPVFDFESEQEEKQLFFYDRDTQQFKRATVMVTSRSCPYSCSFCAIILIGRQWRKASPSKIVADLKALERHNDIEYGHLYFLDANFFVDAKRALGVAQALHEYRPGITFVFSTRVNQLIKGKELLPELRKLGLRAVELGIESGSEAALKRFAKDTTPLQNDEALALLRENNLELYLDFIMFDAEADLDDIQKNLEFFERTHLDSHVPWDYIFTYMTPYLGTAIRQRYEQIAGQKFDEDELPNPIELFQNDKVRSIFIELNKLHAYTQGLADALFHTEERIHLSDIWGPEVARLKLNAATLRRLPFVILRNLLLQAQRGESVAFERALPIFEDEKGYSCSLDEFLLSSTSSPALIET